MNEYDAQAANFLAATGTKITIKRGADKCPAWEDGKHIHGDHYRVTLRNARGSYTFSYWNSHYDMQNGKEPRAYEILVILDADNYGPDNTFEAWCDEYGYDTDSRKAYATWQAVQKQEAALRRIFTYAELEDLAEIQ